MLLGGGRGDKKWQQARKKKKRKRRVKRPVSVEDEDVQVAAQHELWDYCKCRYSKPWKTNNPRLESHPQKGQDWQKK